MMNLLAKVIIYGPAIALVGCVAICFESIAKEVSPELHKKCIDAKDFQGCINAYSGGSSQQDGSVSADPFWYDAKSVKQLKVRGRYGRYLIFTGRTVYNSYDYSWGSGFGNFWGNGGSASGFGSGFGTSSSTRGGAFTYHLDCLEGTADRKKDAYYAQEDTAGWFEVSKDPTAMTVYEKYCPVINTLPKN